MVLRLSNLLILITVLFASQIQTYSGGSGTPEDPYQIAIGQDLIDPGETRTDYFSWLLEG